MIIHLSSRRADGRRLPTVKKATVHGRVLKVTRIPKGNGSGELHSRREFWRV